MNYHNLGLIVATSDQLQNVTNLINSFKEDCFRNDLTLWAHQVERIDKLIRLLQEIKEIK